MAGVAIVVFSDLVESTALLASLGDDRMDQVRRSHVNDVTDAVALGGGRVIKTLGDGVMSSFGSALGALRAAAAIQRAVERQDAEQGGIGIAARIGIGAGEPIPDGDDLHGMSVVIASRLSSAAGTGEILVHDLVQALVASREGVALGDIRELDLKGVPGPVRASELLWRDLPPVATDEAEGGLDSAAAEPGDGEVQRSGPVEIRLPPALAAYADEPLIGRDSEIEELREATAPRAGCRAVLILGEPGIGKTRHAAAAAAEAHGEGAVVVLARCPPESTIAFEPWVRAVGEIALAGDDSWRAELARAAGAELAALVPELSEHATLAERAVIDEVVAAEGARYRLFRGIAAALSFAAGDKSLHVVLDDAHWCDPASAQALASLLESPPARLVLVVTARDREMSRRHPVSRALSALRRTSDLGELRLTGLDASGMAALVGSKVGRAITPALAEQLLARTSGNPFFASELACDLDGQGALRTGEVLVKAPAPEAVTDLVEERLARVGPDTERLLVAVAAIGPAASVHLASRVAGLSSEKAARAVEEALSERLVDDKIALEPTIGFSHALVREALLAGTSDAAIARLHLAIARVLEEDPGTEPAEMARHYVLSAGLAGPERAIAAHRAAAVAAAGAHDHEGAAVHLRQVLGLLEADVSSRALILLELGEQELLSADLVTARDSFREAIEIARQTGDAPTLARAALGFAGGDIGFGFETGVDDPATVALLREGLEALGDSEPRLALGMVFRLAFMLIFTDDDEMFATLERRAKELEQSLGGAEARVLGGLAVLATRSARRPDPSDLKGLFEELDASLDLLDAAEECGREDLLFRVVLWCAAVHYTMARMPECDQALERSAEIAARLGSPRFAWEVDLARAMRLFDLGRREEAEAQLRRAGTIARRLRPDIHIFAELSLMMIAGWIYGGETALSRVLAKAAGAAGLPAGAISIGLKSMASADGDLEATRRELRAEMAGNLEGLRKPDVHLPVGLCFLAHAAIQSGDRETGERVRPLLEPMRSRLAESLPMVGFGQLPEWYIGGLELLAGRLEEAIDELRGAVSRADELELVWVSAWSRVDLATALHRSGSTEEAQSVLVEAESIADRHGVGWVATRAESLRAEIDGREPPNPGQTADRNRPIRALAARGGRRALASMARGLGDEDLERRFVEPRRQRALVRATARGFQPAGSAGFAGTIVYELEPYAIEPPPESPWRWAIEVDSSAGRARLREPAPLDPAVTIHIGLADWVRVTAGLQDPLSAMLAGRCSVEGDVTVAARLEAMFGGR